ncbi:MAG TPA: FAD-dependent oxidoreductase [Ktedonobacteraceae bacterium]|nr:FAD-dependent oxidoreductase [Ktedonobacteraceae bacterium]
MRRSTDVVIVGGGVIGCAIAYFLSKAGVKVMVIERGEIADYKDVDGTTPLVSGWLSHPWTSSRLRECERGNWSWWDRLRGKCGDWEGNDRIDNDGPGARAYPHIWAGALYTKHLGVEYPLRYTHQPCVS